MVMLSVPCPKVIVPPPESVQAYVVPGFESIVYGTFTSLMQTDADPVTDATEGRVDNSISSTAKEGSVPTLSSLFVQLNPILTFGLLSASVGRSIENAVQLPCPDMHRVVLAKLSRRLQVVPL